GEQSEYRIHAAEECQVSLWRYGLRKERVRLLNWHGEHGPRAGVQQTPDGDYTQTGVQWNRRGYASIVHSQRVTAPARSGLYHVPQDTQVSDPIEGRNECHLAPAEWRLLGWLERDGYAYDLYSDYQLHVGTLELDAYKVLILNTHPEYWSLDMYRRVKAWVHER